MSNSDDAPLPPAAAEAAVTSGIITIRCSICGTTKEESFSKRQRNRAMMNHQGGENKIVRCMTCIAKQRRQEEEDNGIIGGPPTPTTPTNTTKNGNRENDKAKAKKKKAAIQSKLEGQQERDDFSADDDDKDKEQVLSILGNKNAKVDDGSDDDDDEEEEAELQIIDNPKPAASSASSSTAAAAALKTPPSLSSIPRKKKDNKAMKKKTSIHDDDSSDGDSDGGDDDDLLSPPVHVSLKELKRQVMGRDLIQDADDGDGYYSNQSEREEEKILAKSAASAAKAARKASESSSSSSSLRHDVECAICRDICYPPISTPCGHSFCKECFDWWKSSTLDRNPSQHLLTCPTCRAPVGKQSLQVNLALKACVVALFGEDVVAKLRAARSSRKGENEGAHTRGYEIISPLDDEFWRSIDTKLRVKRNIVVDAADQRMQLTLALTDIEYGPNSLLLHLCLLQMEEDEAGDSGFPIHLTNPEDENLICSTDQRFQYTHLNVSIKKSTDGGFEPVSRLNWTPNTKSIEFVFDDKIANHHEATAIKFSHDETGTELEIDLGLIKGKASGTIGSAPVQQRQGYRTRPMVYDEEDAEDDEEGDDEEENLNEFEDDGFVVGENDYSDEEMEGQFSDDDDDHCCICNDGGELMICDGGDHLEGCNKSFHAACVDRHKIPDGDWICQDCAKSGGIDASKKGHEFPVPQKETTIRRKRMKGGGIRNDTGFSSDDEVEFTGTNKQKRQKTSSGGGFSFRFDNDHEVEVLESNPSKAKKCAFEDSDDDDEIEVRDDQSKLIEQRQQDFSNGNGDQVKVSQSKKSRSIEDDTSSEEDAEDVGRKKSSEIDFDDEDDDKHQPSNKNSNSGRRVIDDSEDSD